MGFRNPAQVLRLAWQVLFWWTISPACAYVSTQASDLSLWGDHSKSFLLASGNYIVYHHPKCPMNDTRTCYSIYNDLVPIDQPGFLPLPCYPSTGNHHPTLKHLWGLAHVPSTRSNHLCLSSPSLSIHVAINDRTFYMWLSSINVYEWATFPLFPHQLMDTEFVST